jgi:hypothetical protein
MIQMMKQRASLSLSQKRRPRPSQVKTTLPPPSTPSERLQLALELSDFCFALRQAVKRKRP